jgi:hypothetical protein
MAHTGKPLRRREIPNTPRGRRGNLSWDAKARKTKRQDAARPHHRLPQGLCRPQSADHMVARLTLADRRRKRRASLPLVHTWGDPVIPAPPSSARDPR